MFKKMLVTSMVLAASSSIAFAKTTDLKGERDFKAEKSSVTTEYAPTVVETTSSAIIPYVGANLGYGRTGKFSANNGYGVGGVFAGLGKKLGQEQLYYLGGELSADITDYEHGHFYYAKRVGASIIPGVMLNQDTMLYARAGITTTYYIQNHRIHRNVNATASQLGLGLQTSLDKNWDVRGEYVYTGSGIIKNFTRVGSNQINLGLLYKFS